MKKTLLVVLLFFVCSFGLLSMTNNNKIDTLKNHSIDVFLGGGFVRNTIPENTFSPNAIRSGLAGTVRIMWQPEHLLSIGLETGLFHVSTITQTLPTQSGTTEIKSVWSAMPIMLVFSMRTIDRFYLTAGVGNYNLIATNTIDNSRVGSNQFNTGVMFGSMYLLPISNTLSTGLGVTLHSIVEQEQFALSLTAELRWRAIQW
jgi:hypothetical protein